MFRFEYDAQLAYESGKQIPPQQQVGTSASFANSPVDAWGMNGIADDGNSMEALNGDPMLSSTASNTN
ncbi:hypothetical protein AAVH_15480 [Aphelenchoides avenae]|nr:hypothetical protein AAVH_15480 [Aphelenchus avenae]